MNTKELVEKYLPYAIGIVLGLAIWGVVRVFLPDELWYLIYLIWAAVMIVSWVRRRREKKTEEPVPLHTRLDGPHCHDQGTVSLLVSENMYFPMITTKPIKCGHCGREFHYSIRAFSMTQEMYDEHASIGIDDGNVQVRFPEMFVSFTRDES